MRIDHDLAAATERRTESFELPPRTLASLTSGARRPTQSKRLRSQQLNFAGATPSETEFERILGANDLVDEFFLQRALVAARPVCRLRFRDGADIGYATGFMVSPRLLLTNWHVFKRKDVAVDAVAEFDYKLDIRGKPQPGVRFALQPERFFENNQALDYALVAVNEEDDEHSVPLSSFGYHRLAPSPSKIDAGEWISIIQHPSGGYRQFAIRENELLALEDNYLLYRSDTAPGSSGSPAFNDSFQVVALHHSGKARKDGDQYVLKNGTRVPSLEGIDESQVIWDANEGVRISVMVQNIQTTLDSADPFVQELVAAIQSDQGDIMSNTIRTGHFVDAGSPEASVETNRTSISANGASAGIVIPLQLHISLTAGGSVPVTQASGIRPLAVSAAPTDAAPAESAGEG